MGVFKDDEVVKQQKKVEIIENDISVSKSAESEIEQPQVVENQLEKDMQSGNDIIQKSAVQSDWVVMEMPEETLDEQFIKARQIAHNHEKSVSKIKKSTLKKRRAEYERKNAEHETMRAVRDELNNLYDEKLAADLQTTFDQLSVKMGQPLDNVPEKVKKQAMQATMLFQKKDGLGADDMSIIYRDLCFNIDMSDEDFMKELSDEVKKRVKAQFSGKMSLYEKMFADVFSWKPEDFSFKDNHELATDPTFKDKMEKLSMLPLIKDALAEYKTVTSDGRMERLRPDTTKAFLPPDFITELEARVEFFENVHNDMESRMDLMANKYYALLGKSDTANMDINKLAREANAETGKSKDPEMIAYFDAIRRSKVIKKTGKEIKGKKPLTALDKIRKNKGITTTKSGKQAINEGVDDFILKQKTVGATEFKTRIRKAAQSGESSLSYTEIESPEVVSFQIDNVYKNLKLDLNEEDKQEITANYKERLKDSQHARDLILNNEQRKKALMEELDGRLFKEFPQGFKTELREEKTGIVEYLMSPEFEMANKEKKQTPYEVYRTFMLPYLDRSFVNPIKDKEDSDKIIFKIFMDTLKNDNQLDILSKYKDPKDFATHATQEDFNRLMNLRHIGGWVNQLIFERKDQAVISMLEDDDLQTYKDLFVKLRSSAYEFSLAVLAEVGLVANTNYAFMKDDTIQKLNTTKPANNSLEDMKNKQIRVDKAKGDFRIGENAKKRMEADAKVFDKRPEAWAAFAKSHKNSKQLYTESYGMVYYGNMTDNSFTMTELSVFSDEELENKRRKISESLIKDNNTIVLYNNSITKEFLEEKEKFTEDFAGYYMEKEFYSTGSKKGKGKNQKVYTGSETVFVDGNLQELEERVKILHDRFRENGFSFNDAPKDLLQSFTEINDQLNELLKGNMFLLSDIGQLKVWDIISLVRPVINYAEEIKDDAEMANEEDYVPPKYEDFAEDFASELPEFKKKSLAEAKENNPTLKAWLELDDLMKTVQKNQITLAHIEKLQQQREKEKKRHSIENDAVLRDMMMDNDKKIKKMNPNVPDALKNVRYVDIYSEGLSMAQKYDNILEGIERLDSSVITKELAQQIDQDFGYFKDLIENDKNGFIFAMQEDLADELWRIYSAIAPVEAHYRTNKGEPDIIAINKLTHDPSVKVNREDAEAEYRGRVLFDEKEETYFNYMKLNFEFMEEVRLRNELRAEQGGKWNL